METVIGSFVCSNCRTDKPLGEQVLLDNGRDPICNACYENYYITCDYCDSLTHQDNTYQAMRGGDELVICSGCRNSDFFRCNSCDNVYHDDDYGEDGLCRSCVDNRNDDDDNSDNVYRSIRHDPALTPDQLVAGEIITSPQVFGCELEVIVPRDNINDISNYLPKSCGITSDGSINSSDDYNGIELQTPKLAGKAGEEYIKTVCQVLNKYGAKVNQSCGYHLHLSVDKEDWVKLKHLLALYLAFDSVLLSVLPKSRRINNYCKSLATKIHLAELEKIQSAEELDEMWYRLKILSDEDREKIAKIKGNKHHDSRYTGINLHSAFVNGSVEVRYHSGTIQPSKILNWVALHQAIYKVANKSVWDKERPQKWLAITNPLKKAEELFNYIDLPASLREYFIGRITSLNDY